ncbi:hypothetical protein ACQ859_00880 [Roseateles chitinivorans]|uniref:hypothetical protein n=1 Tax=Roseateles chitinivorans TaxID=2917965 RepID=UPI003D666199
MNAAMKAPMNAALPSPGLGGHAAALRAIGRSLRRVWWLLLPVATITGLASIRSASAAGAAFCISTAILLQFAWWICGTSLTMQNHPDSARLVPGHVRQLREVAVALFFVIAVADGLLMHAVFGRFLMFTMIAGAAIVGFGVTMRWPWAWFVIWVAPWFVGPLLPDAGLWRNAANLMRDWHEQQPLMQTVLCMLAMAAVLWRMLQDGDAAHRRSWRATRQIRDMFSMKGGAHARPPETRLGRVLAKPFSWGLPAWREHLLRTASPTADSVVARAEIAAMRGAHWSSILSAAVVVVVLLLVAELAALFWLPESRGTKVLQGALPGSSFGVMCALFGPMLSATTTLYRTRAEQSLLVLVPGMPRGEAMNRVMARRLLTQFFVVLGFGAGSLLLMAALAPGDWSDEMPLMGLYFAATAVPGCLLLWLDWSRQRQPGAAQSGVMILAMVLAMGMGVAGHRLLDLSPWHILAVTGPLTAALGAWRWRAVRRMAPFWPVGRRAGD